MDLFGILQHDLFLNEKNTHRNLYDVDFWGISKRLMKFCNANEFISTILVLKDKIISVCILHIQYAMSFKTKTADTSIFGSYDRWIRSIGSVRLSRKENSIRLVLIK